MAAGMWRCSTQVEAKSNGGDSSTLRYSFLPKGAIIAGGPLLLLLLRPSTMTRRPVLVSPSGMMPRQTALLLLTLHVAPA